MPGLLSGSACFGVLRAAGTQEFVERSLFAVSCACPDCMDDRADRLSADRQCPKRHEPAQTKRRKISACLVQLHYPSNPASSAQPTRACVPFFLHASLTALKSRGRCDPIDTRTRCTRAGCRSTVKSGSRDANSHAVHKAVNSEVAACCS